MGALRYARQRLGMGRGLPLPQSAGDASRWIRAYAPRELRNRRHSRWQLLIRLDHGSIGHSVANADREPYVQCGLTCCAYAQRLSISPRRFLTSLSSGAATNITRPRPYHLFADFAEAGFVKLP